MQSIALLNLGSTTASFNLYGIEKGKEENGRQEMTEGERTGVRISSFVLCRRTLILIVQRKMNGKSAQKSGSSKQCMNNKRVFLL